MKNKHTKMNKLFEKSNGKRINIYDTIKIPQGLTKKIDHLINISEQDFTSRTDVIKYAVRLLYTEIIKK